MQARTRRVKARASADLKAKGQHKWPGGSRSGQENPSATKVSRSIRESNRSGWAESRGPPEMNKRKWKQRMMGQ